MASRNSPHQMISSRRVTGTPVFDDHGDMIGHVHDLSIDKLTGQVTYALLGFGGFLGIAEHYQTLPWSDLRYENTVGGYVVHVRKADLARAPSLSADDLEQLGVRQRPVGGAYYPYPMI